MKAAIADPLPIDAAESITASDDANEPPLIPDVLPEERSLPTQPGGDPAAPGMWNPGAWLPLRGGIVDRERLPRTALSELAQPRLQDDAPIEYNVKRTITSHFGGANSAHAIDLDGDGDMDVIGSAYDVNEVAWWENDGDAAFTRQTIDNTFNDAMYARTADLNGDGDIDVVAAAYSDGITWWENDGRERFTTHVVANTIQFSNARVVQPADMDGDGDVDLVAVGGNNITWWQNDGSGAFTQIGVTATFTGARSVFPVDLDGDDDMDLIGAAHNTDPEVADITWWENDGEQAFTPHDVDTTFEGAFALDAVDLDGDGDMDVLGAASNANQLTWWENQGAGTLAKQVVAASFDAAMSIAGADIDGDGDLDIVGASFIDGLHWWENDGSQAFTDHGLPGAFAGAWSVDVADMNGDGDTDLLGAAGLKDDSKVAWWENDGQETFSVAIIASDFAGAISAHAADLDGDGDQDVLGAAYSSNKIIWWENEDGLHYREHTITSQSWSVYSVFAGDLDGDGDQDVLGAARYDGVKWWQNDGSGVFAARTIANDFADARSVYAVDLDDDGDLDVLGAANNTDPEDVDIAWWENDGEGGFTQHNLGTEFADAIQVISVDMDSDGDRDIVAAGALSLMWWENNGQESFSAHIVGGNYDNMAVAAADLDGDGDVDALGASGDEIAWWMNDGQEVFTKTVFDGDFCEVRAVTTVDLDGDSDIDVLAAAYGTGELAWWENDQGVFTRHSIATEFQGARAITASDLTGDGQINIIGVAYDAAEIAWWSQHTASLDLVEGWNLTSLAAAPMNTGPASVLESIAGQYEVVLAHDAETDEWLWYDPTDTENSTLAVLDETVGFWIKMTENATLTMLAIPLLETDQDLVAGWNLISYPARETRPIANALGTIEGTYTAIAGYATGEEMPWRRYTVGVPEWLNTLSDVSTGNAYWLNVSADCTLVIED